MERMRERDGGGESPSYICGCRLQSIINAMQISSRADKRCNDGCQFPPHRRLPQGVMENEKTTEGETEKGRAMVREELERKKKSLEQTCFVVCLFPWERDRKRDKDCMSK